MSDNSASDTHQRKLVSPVAMVVHLVLAACFFVFMTRVLYIHTPDFSDEHKLLSAAFTSTCLTGVFWLTLCGLHVTFMDQMRREKSGRKYENGNY